MSRGRKKPISISLSPNVQRDDVWLAWKLLFQPWKWTNHNATKQLEEAFKRRFGVAHAIAFNSGRASLFAILQALELQKGSDVFLQAFTCNAVVNPILWAGLNPLYIDCDTDFNINLEELSKQITPKRNIVILQHTFGLPANLDSAISIVRQNGGILIEDGAHALGAMYQGKPVGTIGDVGFFSFSRDKVISSVYGGMVITNNDTLGKKLQTLQMSYGNPSRGWILQQILHPILLSTIILPLYHVFDLGKLFLIFSQWFHILSKAVTWKEKRGLKPDYFPKSLPGALASMAHHQFKKLDTFNTHRQTIADYYYRELQGTSYILPQKEGNLFLRFAIQHPKAHEIIYDAWHHENMLLGDWYTSAIAPDDTKIETMHYTPGTCPTAESLAKKTLNLPTHINISENDAKRVVEFLKKYR